MRELIEETLKNSGLINNFTHWHNVVRDGNLGQYEKYLRMLAAMNAYGDIAFCGYGEALDYMVFREIIEDVRGSIENDMLIIELRCNPQLRIDYELLQIPVTVKVCYGNMERLVDVPYSGPQTIFRTKI